MTVRPKHGFDIAFRRFIDFHALNASCFHVRFFRARFFVNLLLIYSNHAFLSQCFFMRFLAVVLPLLRWNFTLKIHFHLSIKCPTMKLNTLFQEPQVQRVLGA